jgi:hypothetical protein
VDGLGGSVVITMDYSLILYSRKNKNLRKTKKRKIKTKNKKSQKNKKIP